MDIVLESTKKVLQNLSQGCSCLKEDVAPVKTDSEFHIRYSCSSVCEFVHVSEMQFARSQ